MTKMCFFHLAGVLIVVFPYLWRNAGFANFVFIVRVLSPFYWVQEVEHDYENIFLTSVLMLPV